MYISGDHFPSEYSQALVLSHPSVDFLFPQLLEQFFGMYHCTSANPQGGLPFAEFTTVQFVFVCMCLLENIHTSE